MENIYCKLLVVLKEIQLKKLLNDDSLGRYAKIHLEHIFKHSPIFCNELIEKNELKKYLNFIEKDAREMYNHILEEYNPNGRIAPDIWKCAEDWVISKLTSKTNRQ